MRRAFLTMAAGLALAACAAVLDFDGFDTSAARPEPAEAGADAEIAPFAIHVASSDLRATTGVPAVIHVTIERRAPIDTPILFALGGATGLAIQAAPVAPSVDAVDVAVVAGNRHGLQRVTLSATTAAYPSFVAEVPLTVDVRGAPGSLDTTFGTGGIAVTGILGFGADVALGADGGIVGAFFPRSDQLSPGLSLVRVLTDGTLDPAFGDGGVVHHGGGGSAGGLRGGVAYLAVLPDARMVVGWDAYPDVVVGRLLADGRPDPTFPDAVVIPNDTVANLDRTSAGKILVSGTLTTRRLFDDGGIDTTFGDAGDAITGSANKGTGVTSFADDSLVVMQWLLGDTTILAYRIGAGGEVEAPLTLVPGCSTHTRQLRRAEGRWYVLLGCDLQPSPTSSRIVRYESDGSPSAAFGKDHIEVRAPGAIVLVDGGVVHAASAGDLAPAVTEYLDDGGTAWSTSLAGKVDGLDVAGAVVDGERVIVFGQFGSSNVLVLARLWL